MTFGVTTTPRATMGGEATPIRLRPRWFVLPRTARGMPSIRSTRPLSPKPSNRRAGLGVERDQIPLVSPEEDAGIVPAAPPGDPARVVEVGRPPAPVDLRVVHPDRLAGRGVDGRHLVQRGRDVQHPGHHQRRRLEHPDPEARKLLAQPVEIERPVGRRPAPGNLKVVEVAGVDLVEGRVLGAAGVAAVASPFAVRGAVLGVRIGRPERGRAPRQEHHGNENRRAAPGAVHRHLQRHYTRVAGRHAQSAWGCSCRPGVVGAASVRS